MGTVTAPVAGSPWNPACTSRVWMPCFFDFTTASREGRVVGTWVERRDGEGTRSSGGASSGPGPADLGRPHQDLAGHGVVERDLGLADAQHQRGLLLQHRDP